MTPLIKKANIEVQIDKLHLDGSRFRTMITTLTRRSRLLFRLAFCLFIMWCQLEAGSAKELSVSACFRHYNLSEGEIVNRLMKNYTKALPEIEGPVSVRIEMRIQQVSALNELTRDFEIEILFSQLW